MRQDFPDWMSKAKIQYNIKEMFRLHRNTTSTAELKQLHEAAENTHRLLNALKKQLSSESIARLFKINNK